LIEADKITSFQPYCFRGIQFNQSYLTVRNNLDFVGKLYLTGGIRDCMVGFDWKQKVFWGSMNFFRIGRMNTNGRVFQVKYYGLEIIDNGNFIIQSRPRPRQRLLFLLTVIIGLLAAAAALAAGQVLGAIAVLVIGGAVAVYFYREFLISSRERLELGTDEILRWVKVRGLTADKFERPLNDITPDEQGDRILIKTLVHDSPGSRVIEGYPATLSVFISRGEAAGYDKIFMVRTIEQHIEPLVETLVKKLPSSRR